MGQKKEWETNPGACFNHYVADPNIDKDCYACTNFKWDSGCCQDYVTVQSMKPITPDTYKATVVSDLERKVYKE